MSIIYVKQTSLCAQYVCLESSLNLECMGVSPYKYRLSLYGLDFTLYKFQFTLQSCIEGKNKQKATAQGVKRNSPGRESKNARKKEVRSLFDREICSIIFQQFCNFVKKFFPKICSQKILFQQIIMFHYISYILSHYLCNLCKSKDKQKHKTHFSQKFDVVLTNLILKCGRDRN